MGDSSSENFVSAFLYYRLEFSISQVIYRIFYILKDVERNFRLILKEFLEENNLTQTAFAGRVQVKPSQVSEWLKGKAKPGYDTLRAMSKAFDISADYFLGLTDSY